MRPVRPPKGLNDPRNHATVRIVINRDAYPPQAASRTCRRASHPTALRRNVECLGGGNLACRTPLSDLG
jgi:hypothetical protein